MSCHIIISSAPRWISDLNEWSSLWWGYLNFRSPWILSRVFLRTPILFLEPYHITHHILLLFFSCCFLLLVLAVAPWSLLLPWPLLVHLLLFCFFFHDVFQSLLSISHIIHHLLDNKEAVSRTLCSLSVSASRVAATGADTALYNCISQKWIYLLLICFWEIFWKFYGQNADHLKVIIYRWKKPMKTYLNLR